MSSSPIRGKTITFSFQDGAMAGKSFEHAFHVDGTLQYGAPGASGQGERVAYEVARITDDVHAVSYLGAGGYTLTAILTLSSGKLVAFSSNADELALQHGTFEVRARDGARPTA
ncbi:MAG: hypothetical protein U1F43_17645 [Myxococcota bacterium]